MLDNFLHSFFVQPPDNIYHTLFIFNLLQRQFSGKQCEKNQYSIKIKTRRQSAEENSDGNIVTFPLNIPLQSLHLAILYSNCGQVFLLFCIVCSLL